MMEYVYPCAVFVMIIFGIALCGARLEIKHLKRARAVLQSEVNYLVGEMSSRLDLKCSVILSLAEKQMILGALNTPQHSDRITAPATKYLIREVYHSLVKKMRKSITEGSL